MKDNKIRLQKFLAENGVASRRKSEELIEFGKVKVNGEVWNKTTYCVEEERNFTFIGDGDMKDENIIEIEY